MFDLGTPEWSAVLRQGLGARTILVSDQSAVVSVAIFSAGPFRIAYPDFPHGATGYSSDALRIIVDSCRSNGVDLIRLQTRRPVESTLRVESLSLGTTRIEDFRSWHEGAYDKSRRARNRSLRSDLEIGPPRPEERKDIFEMYAGTIRRKRGVMRYGLEYFSCLPPDALLVARVQGVVSGFVCFARRGGTGYYLHGGHLPAAKAHHPSDQLFLAMLRLAREADISGFDFLPSPTGQPDLERYKCSWGGTPADLIVSDLPLNRLRSHAFSLVRKLADNIPKSASEWLAANWSKRA